MSSTIRTRLTQMIAAVIVLAVIAANVLVTPRSAQAAGSINLVSTYMQIFDAFLSPMSLGSSLPPGWAFAESGTNADSTYSSGAGSSTTGDTYGFGSVANPTDRAFGTLRSGSLVSTIGASFTNITGKTITELAIAYTGEQWRLGTLERADRLDFQLSTDAITLTNGTWTDQDDLDFTSPITNTTVGALDGNVPANRTQINPIIPIEGLNIPPGATFWIRWVDFDAAGSDDGLAVDDFSITAGTNPTPPSGVGTASPSTVESGNPTLLTVAVTPGANPSSTGIGVVGNLSAIGGSAGQLFFDDGTNGDVTAGDNVFSFLATVNAGPGPKSLVVSLSDAELRPNIATISLTVFDPTLVRHIHDIQGAAHISPRIGQTVSNVLGTVTAKRSNGFYMQDPTPDSDDATSEGMFVFTATAPAVSVGDAVAVAGTVAEFRADGSSSANLTVTEISAPTVSVVSSGNTLPPPIVIGSGGRIPPTTVIEDDATSDAELNGVFDPANDGIDFYESLEGMRVQVNNPVAAGPTNSGELVVIGDDGANASVRTTRGGIVVRANDFNPERIILDSIAGGPTIPLANVGDHFSAAAVGVLDYNGGNYKLEVTAPLSVVSGNLAREATAAASSTQLAVATFNVENLAPADGPAKFNALASLIVNNLKAPDIVALEEVQDNSGATNNGIVDATTTYTTLIAAITAAGGPTYQFRQIDPANNQDGGQPGGNIRQGFLFRVDRGLSFTDRAGGGALVATTVISSGVDTHLAFSPGRIDPTNGAFASSRKPLAGEFMFNGHKQFVIANHFNSKCGDQPLYGRFQPPVRGSETQRHQQAQIVHDFVQSLVAADPSADVIVLGDLNDYEFSDALTTLSTGVLHDLIERLPQSERYTYVFEGNSQALDHILLSDHLNARSLAYDVVHVNAEFAAQVSDHDPQVVRLSLGNVFTYLPLMRR